MKITDFIDQFEGLEQCVIHEAIHAYFLEISDAIENADGPYIIDIERQEIMKRWLDELKEQDTARRG